MSNNRLVLNTDEFRQALRNLPQELAAEANPIVIAATEQSKAEIVAGYPVGPPRKNQKSGNLKRGVVSSIETSRFGTFGTVKSRAQHAHLWEFGSEVREYKGADRGRMPKPPQPNFVPVVVRKRRAMYESLIRLLQRTGFQVSGDV